MTVHSFAPLANPSAEYLILGSMPGKASLIAQQYYAHPRNLFWPFMNAIFDIEQTLSYRERCIQLLDKGVAVWDVLKTCTRSSSLDSDIVESSIVVNDFIGFFQQHTLLHTVCFNGAKAEQVFKRYVLAEQNNHLPQLNWLRLPSTSPANAAITSAVKLTAWRQALTGQQDDS